MKVFIVDVFPTKKYSGNQVAVIKVPPDGQLSTEELQQIAVELDYLETCFILSDRQEDGSYDVRVFTPKKEVSFSGDPIIGTSFVIHKYCELDQGSDKDNEIRSLEINQPSGKTHVDIRSVPGVGTTYWMIQKEPQFWQIYGPILLSKILSIDHEKISRQYPIQEVSTGLPMIIVPIADLATLKQISINLERYNWLMRTSKAKVILCFCPETTSDQKDFTARVFADYYGISEDPATGSGIGSLSAYCLKYMDAYKDECAICVEQGNEINRPSLVSAKAVYIDDQKIEVRVGGNVQLVVEGELL